MEKIAIISGGAGFVGSHLVDLFLRKKYYDLIVILDLCPPKIEYQDSSIPIHYIETDLRNKIDSKKLKMLGCDENTTIYNLAAICRIPGFPNSDYFETNIQGAESICSLAEDLDVQRIVFTSSVAPYGGSEQLKHETSIPEPDNAYGSSKLVAEYIHKGWYEKNPENRVLSILRPGIIFGKGENANFTRLYKSIKGNYFFYPGRTDTKKACIYVKDVANACLHFSEYPIGFHMYNLVYEKAPSILEICKVIEEKTDAGKVLFKIPSFMLITAAYIIYFLGRVFSKELTGIHPDRVKKLMISTNISGKKLNGSKFQLEYALPNAIQDWFEDCERKELT